MNEKIICRFDPDIVGELTIRSRGKHWIVIPMEELAGRSLREVRCKWKGICLSLEKTTMRRYGGIPDCVAEIEKRSEENPWFIYWMLPNLIRRVYEAAGSVKIWLRGYDTPLLRGLAGGYSHGMTALVTEIVDSCLEEIPLLDEIYLTGHVPFALPRLGIFPRHPREKWVEKQQQKMAGEMLRRYISTGGKAAWRSWIGFLEGEKHGSGVLLSDSPGTEEAWWQVAKYCDVENMILPLIRESLGRVQKTRAAERHAADLKWHIREMARYWNCETVDELEDLLCLMLYCHGRKEELTSLLLGGKIVKNPKDEMIECRIGGDNGFENNAESGEKRFGDPGDV